MAYWKNYYELLGIPQDATPEELRRAHRDAALKLHPDVNPDPKANEIFLEIQKAYELLSNPLKRAEYDQQILIESDAPVAVDIEYSRTTLSTLNEPQLIYALLDFSAAAKYKSVPAPPLNISLVIDRSTSMQGVRMDTVKLAAIEMIRQLRQDDLISIVTFSDRADVLVPSTRQIDRNSIETQIRLIRVGGGTEIFQGLSAGLAEINRNLARSLINHIILITDGRTYGDEDACLELAQKAALQGVRITGLGMGTEWNDVFLDEIGRRTGGSSFYVSRIEDLMSFLREKFTSLSQIYAERAVLGLKMSPDVSLTGVFRLQPDASVLSSGPSLHLGSIPKNSNLSILLEFVVSKIPEHMLRQPLCNGDLNLVLPFDPSKPRSISFSLSRLVSNSISTELPPQRIYRALSQVTLYRMQEKARQEVNEGKIQQASTRLQRLSTHLLSIGEAELAKTAMIEAERIQQTHMLSAEGEKRIKYGTRSLLLPANATGGR